MPTTLGSWRYYDHEVGVEDYFLGHGEEQGVWVGSGAAALGLSGTVEEGQLARLFDEGRHPLSGEPLGLPYRHDAKRTVVTGFALSFSPPKSVSLVGAFGGAGVAGEVDAAHDAAVTAALGFLEEHAAFSRTGRGGPFQVDTEGYVAAAFTHRTSRAGDPQVHSHVLVANKVRCVDGRWRSLDGREVFAFQKGAGMAYNATLRVELTARLGVAWEPVDRNGQADIRGVPQGLIEHFSKRRKDVEIRGGQRIAAAEARLGRTLTDDERAEQYQFATYDTRPPKGGHEDEGTLSGRWRTEATTAGWEAEHWLPSTLGQTREREALLSAEVADPAVMDELVAELAEARSTWGRAEAAKAVARRLPADLAGEAEAGRRWIEATSAAVLGHPEVVTLAAPLSAAVPDGLRRRDGLPSHDRHGASRQSTPHIDAGAGPDRRPELRRLQRLHSDLPILRNVVAANERDVARVDQTIARTRQSLADAQARLYELTRPRRFRRPDEHAIAETSHRIHAQQRYLGRLEDERARLAGQLDRSRRRLADAERAVARIPEVEADVTRRGDWLLSHPAELAWESDLASRLAGPTNEPEATLPGQDPAEPDHDLEAILRSIDLRTIDLPAHRPRTGFQRDTSKALGLSRRAAADIALPPLPGHGLDAGPDLGL